MKLALLLYESPHTRMMGYVELPYITAGSHVDWGFEDMGLEPEQMRTLELAVRTGRQILVTGDLALTCHYPDAALIPVRADQAKALQDAGLVLPPGWMRAIYVLDPDYNYTWIGDQVRGDRVDLRVTERMQRVPEGWAANPK